MQPSGIPGKPLCCDLGGWEAVLIATSGGLGIEVQRVFLQSPPPPYPGARRTERTTSPWEVDLLEDEQEIRIIWGH